MSKICTVFPRLVRNNGSVGYVNAIKAQGILTRNVNNPRICWNSLQLMKYGSNYSSGESGNTKRKRWHNGKYAIYASAGIYAMYLAYTYDWRQLYKESIASFESFTRRFIADAAGFEKVDEKLKPETGEMNGKNLPVDEKPEEVASKKKMGFRDKKIVEYENRIRSFSTPDKIFRYFATIKIVYDVGDSEVFMTPDDFLRALTPGIKQPEGFGLDQFKKVDISKGKDVNLENYMAESVTQKTVECGLRHDSIFYKLSQFGLINYSDFLFLLTVLSVSHRHFEIAFRMFDLNGDGNVDYEEFEKVQNAILQQTSIGKKIGSAVKGNYRGVSSCLSRYFFGEDLKQKLTTEKFLTFQRQLQNEMLTLEFERKKPNEDGKIKESSFAELLIAYAGLPEKKRIRMLQRVKKAYPDTNISELPERGISLEDYLRFFHFLQNVNDVDIALTFFNIANASIDEATLKHAAKTVAFVDLRDHLIRVIFTLFDENQDGQLSNREFISVMKERVRRGLGRPKDTGFIKLLHSIWNSIKMDII